MNKSLYIIDGHAHIYSAFYAPMRNNLTSPSGEPTKAVYIFTTMLLGLIQSKKPDYLVVTMDSKAPSFRKDIYPDYKAQRPPMPDEMPSQIARIEQIVDALNIPLFRVDGYEADDLIGTLSKAASKEKIDVYICSKDKDMLQLIDKHIFTYDIKSDSKTNLDSMKADLEITPSQFLEVLALQGDKADNVPGIPDVGPKTALGWIQKYGSIENLYEHENEIKGKRGENLKNSHDIVKLSKTLVTIDTNVDLDIDYEKFKISTPDTDKLSQLFNELGFSRLAGQMGLIAKQPTTKSEQSLFEVDGQAVTHLKSSQTEKHDYKLINTKADFDNFLIELKKQKIFAVDTETTSIEAARAQLVGMSFCWEKGNAFYLPVKGPMGSTVLDIDYVREKLSPIFADEKIKKIGQNIKYDMIVLHNAKMPLSGVYFDCMVASYCIDPTRRSHSMDNMAHDFLNYECITISALIGKGKNQLTFDMIDLDQAAEYAAEDADVTLRLYEYLDKRLNANDAIKKLFEDVEIPLVTVLATMELNGVSLDTALLKKLSNSIADEVISLSEKIYELAGGVFNIDSPKQLGEILFDRLGLKSVRKGKAGRSTDAAVLETLSQDHPIVSLVLDYRQLRKLQTTYVDKLGSLINPRTNRVHASFNQTITATGRLSSSNPNLQNIPIRSELGKKIRQAFIPEEKDFCILSADYSQIELRLLAHFSKDKALIDAFEQGRDIHSFVASQVYGVDVEDVTSHQRSSSKAVNFGIIYGQGAFGLSRTTGMSQGEAKKFIEDYFARYSSIRAFMDSIIKGASSNGYVETILGRRREIWDINSSNGNKQKHAERMAVNTVIQGSAADLIKVAMINIQRRIEHDDLPIKMILQIHDELVFELPTTMATKYEEWIVSEMVGCLELDVPLKVDTSCGPNWGK